MRRNIFAPLILITSIIVHSSFSKHIDICNPRFISFGVGTEVSKMGNLTDSASAQFGGGVNYHFYVGKNSGVSVMSSVHASYLMRDEFKSTNRAIDDHIYGINESGLDDKRRNTH